MEILPAILARNEEEFLRKLGNVRGLGLPIQVDVADGVFVNGTTWSPIDRVTQMLNDTPFEAHLMVSNPEHAALVWLTTEARRVWFHIEATRSESLILKVVTDINRIGVAINPDTPISRLAGILDKIGWVLVMGVPPGSGGQEFLQIAVEKVVAIKQINPTVKVAVDGGINPRNIGLLVKAGTDAVAVGTALTDAINPELALAELKEAINMANTNGTSL
jgi:ribulose-phosphate 3-epimerase